MRIARIAIVALAPFALLACSDEPEEVEVAEESAPKPVRTPPPSSFGTDNSSGGFSDGGGGGFASESEVEVDDGLNEDGEPRRSEDLR